MKNLDGWQFLFGYWVYILLDKAGREIGYCFISNGGSPRYPFASKNDLIVGPYFVVETERKKGLAFLLLSKCLQEIEIEYNLAWDFIQHYNKASIITTEKVGFMYYSDCKYSKYLRILNLISDKTGDEMLFCYKREKYNV